MKTLNIIQMEIYCVVIFYFSIAYAANTLVNDDVDLENFKNAVRIRPKRSTTDVQTLVKCSAPLAQDNDGMTDKEKARKLGLCLARDALRKAATGKDSAKDMVRRIQQLYENNKLSLTKRGWWSKAVSWVKKHASIIYEGIKIAVKIVQAIAG